MKKNQIHRAAIVLAAGSGQRLNLGVNKSWLKISSKELVLWSLIWLEQTQLFNKFVLVVHENELAQAREILRKNLGFNVEIITGGTSRHSSETQALKYLANDIKSGQCDYVLIHDGARPLATPELIKKIVFAAEKCGGALPYLPTAKLISDASLFENLIKVQTPQVFKAEETLNSYLKAESDGFTGSDTSMCLEKYAPNLPIKAVLGTAQNLKVTYPDDVELAESVLNQIIKTR